MAVTTYEEPGVLYESPGYLYNGSSAPSRGGSCFVQGGLNEQLQYIKPDGTKYRLHAPPSRVVISEEGFGTPPLDYVVDRAPFQHGDTVRDFFLKPRAVQVVILQNFVNRGAYWDGRTTLLDTIRPNTILDFTNPGKLLYYLGNGYKRQLDVFLDSGPGFQPDQPGWRKWSFTEVLRFTAHDPVWYDPDLKTVAFTSESPDLTFPITFPITFGSFGTDATVSYDGSWQEYPSFVITGPITGLTIDNLSTGESIKLNYTLPAGYTITVTLRGVKSITRSDGVNLLNYLTSDSDLSTFSLQPDPQVALGTNTIRVSGSATAGATSVSMMYYDRYFGI